MFPKWLTPILVAVVAGFSLWLLSSQAPKQPRLITLNKSAPDSFMVNFTTQNLDENGNPRHELKANYMAHYPVSDYSEFTLPELILYQSGKQRWTVSADKGKTTKDIKEILLEGKVNINRLNESTGESDLTIKTHNLLIRPDETYVETNKEIIITSGKSSVQSRGARANLDDGKVELLSQVRGVYAL